MNVIVTRTASSSSMQRLPTSGILQKTLTSLIVIVIMKMEKERNDLQEWVDICCRKNGTKKFKKL